MFFETHAFKSRRAFGSRITEQGNLFVDDNNTLLKLEIGRDEDNITSVKTIVQKNFEGNAISVLSNGYFTLVLKMNGTVWAWGRNMYCQCGQENLSDDIESPTQIKKLEDIVQVSCGTHHSVALDKNGKVWRWGTIHDTTKSPTWEDAPHDMPYMVKELSDIIWVSCGQESYYALDKNGTIWGYGSNYDGALGNPESDFIKIPVQIFENNFNLTAVYMCFREGCAITDDGQMLHWTFERKRKSDNITERLLYKPSRVELSGAVAAISTSGSNTVLLNQMGELWAWGDNFGASLGSNIPFDIEKEEQRAFLPVNISTIPLNPLSSLISHYQGLAIYEDELWGWGSNLFSSTPIKLLPELDISNKSAIEPRTAYSKHYIAFLDILGFKNLILSEPAFNSLIVKSRLELLAHLDEHFKRFDTKVMLMSDSIVISIRDDVPHAIYKFLYAVAEVNGMLNGAIMRGGISYGDLYHKGNITFGPAFITAYQLQEHHATYPRIIINSESNKSVSLLSQEHTEIMQRYFLLDDDNYIFFDYLSYLRDNPNVGFGAGAVMSSLVNAILINYFATPLLSVRVAEKYEWLLKYMFLWQLKNPVALEGSFGFNFKISHFHSEYNITDVQKSYPIIKQTVIIRNNNHFLMLKDNQFPTFNQSSAKLDEFIESLKSYFCESNVEFSSSNPTDIFENFGVRIYYDSYKKRPIFEMTKYYCYDADNLDLTKSIELMWIDRHLMDDYKHDLVNSLFPKEQL